VCGACPYQDCGLSEVCLHHGFRGTNPTNTVGLSSSLCGLLHPLLLSFVPVESHSYRDPAVTKAILKHASTCSAHNVLVGQTAGGRAICVYDCLCVPFTVFAHPKGLSVKPYACQVSGIGASCTRVARGPAALTTCCSTNAVSCRATLPSVCVTGGPDGRGASIIINASGTSSPPASPPAGHIGCSSQGQTPSPATKTLLLSRQAADIAGEGQVADLRLVVAAFKTPLQPVQQVGGGL